MTKLAETSLVLTHRRKPMDNLLSEAEKLYELLDAVGSDHALVVRGLINRVEALENMTISYEELSADYSGSCTHSGVK
jgi:hypothetical protein